MIMMAKIKHKEYTDTHHSSSGFLEYELLSIEVKMMHAMNVSSIFIMPGNVERNPMFSPCGLILVRTTSPTYAKKHSQDSTEAPIWRWHFGPLGVNPLQVKKAE